MTETVRPLFAVQQPPEGPAEAEQVTKQFIATARAIAIIAATRALLLITTLTGSGIWALAVWEPTRERLYAAIAFSVVFVVPQVLLYFKRG